MCLFVLLPSVSLEVLFLTHSWLNGQTDPPTKEIHTVLISTLCFGFLTRSDTNQPVQSQKNAKGLNCCN